MRRQYRRKANQHVVAVQLSLDFDGFSYRKWGAEQHCKAGDWLVDSGGDVYTVERATFERTYRAEQPGQYRKITAIWAEPAGAPGAVQTQEGVTHYAAGDYLVSEEETARPSYAVSAAKFAELYELVP
jgi:hypothetical protein